MKKIKSVLRSSMALERMYYLALPNTEQDIVHKMDFTEVIDLFTAAKHQEKTVFSVFFWTCNFGFRSHLFLYQKLFCCQFSLKILLFQFLRLLHFLKSYIWIQSYGF